MGLLGALVSSLAWALTADQVAARIRNKITSKWKTQGLQVQVVPFADTTQAPHGRFKSISVSANGVWVSDVKMSPVRIKASDVTLDLNALVRQNQVVTTRRKIGSFIAKVSEADLNKALSHKDTPIQDLHVALSRGTLVFTGRYKLGFGVNLRLEGKLESPDHYKINFVPTKASVSGVPLPAGPLKVVLSKMNPLVDLRKLPLNPRISKLIVEPSGLVVQG